MGKKLIICEKPSLAKVTARACGLMGEKMNRNEGYFEGENYIVSNALGHLFALKDPEDYWQISPDENGRFHWKDTADRLPFVPERFDFKCKPDCYEQFKILKTLMNRDDVMEIIHFGDADREGEVIIRLILEKGLEKLKPILRIWGEDQTEETILECLRNLKDDAVYDTLYAEGLVRTYMDWIYGINLTRLLTLKMPGKGTLKTGRVLVPIVKEIYDRCMMIDDFTPETYYQAESHTKYEGKDIDLVIKNNPEKNDGGIRYSKEDAERIAAEINSSGVTVVNVSAKRKIVKPPKLFSLSKLQSFMGSEHKWTPDETLAQLQLLYQDGYTTYPRTNTEYMSEGEVDKVNQIIAAHNARADGGLVIKNDKSIFDSKKVESHSAITPTAKLPGDDYFINKDKQLILYNVISNRFYAVFCKNDCVVNETIITLEGAGNAFQLKGEVMVEPGFTVYEKRAKADKELPALTQGQHLETDFMVMAKQTTPPKKHTVESLLGYLNNPFRKEKMNEEELYEERFSGVEIGTEATRAGIIKNALDNGYISFGGNAYSIAPLGKYFIECLNACHINLYKERSVELNQLLLKVRNRQMSVQDCIDFCRQDIEALAENMKDVVLPDSPMENISGKGIAECPYCKMAGRDGGLIFEGENNFYCSNNTKAKNKICNFSLSKKAHEKLTGKKVTAAQVKAVAEKGVVKVKIKEGEEIKLVLSQNGIYTNLNLKW